MTLATHPYRLLITGGGTGGHIFPALAIANAFKKKYPDAHILFVGAKGRMEMKRVPEAGYKIIGLWISGLQRKLSPTNLLFPIKLVVSFFKSLIILKKFNPHVVVGTGGYVSGPIMMAANRLNIPTLIQEQNSYAGLANKRVAKKAGRICVAYEGMEKYFPSNKIVFTGNPVREDILQIENKRNQGLSHFGFDSMHKTLLVLGGSLGSKTINESFLKGIEKILDANVQLIWQTGKYYFSTYQEALKPFDLRKIRLHDFLREMDLAYAAADLVISRSGALALSELSVVGKPCLLVPSPNVAEDHQTKNAMALVNKGAALMISDEEAREKLVDTALKTLFDEKKLNALGEHLKKEGKPKATNDIVIELEKLILK